jgi:hypothetical protein
MFQCLKSDMENGCCVGKSQHSSQSHKCGHVVKAFVPTRKITNQPICGKRSKWRWGGGKLYTTCTHYFVLWRGGVMYVDASLEHLMVPMFGMKVVKY